MPETPKKPTSWFAKPKPKKIPEREPEPLIQRRPPGRQGWLEKKNSKAVGSAGWSRKFCKIDENEGKFLYFKSDKLFVFGLC